MDRQRLREQLRNLHEELGRANSLDEESRRLLFELADDIRKLVVEPYPENREREGGVRVDSQGRATPTGGEEAADFRDRLEDSAREFEVRHPALTEAINRILDALPK